MQQRIFAKNVPKLQKSSCDSPKNGDSYFKNKCFTIFGTCNIMCTFNTCRLMKKYDMQYAHKIMKKELVAKFGKNVIICYHFVII